MDLAPYDALPELSADSDLGFRAITVKIKSFENYNTKEILADGKYEQ